MIFREFDPNEEYPGEQWENDRYLVRELKKKYGSREPSESAKAVELPELRQLVEIGAIDPTVADRQVRRSVRSQVILTLMLPQLGKDKLEKREQRQFDDFAEDSIYPMGSDEFVGWYRNLKTELAPEKNDSGAVVATHFKAGDITSAIEKLRNSLQSFQKERKNR